MKPDTLFVRIHCPKDWSDFCSYAKARAWVHDPNRAWSPLVRVDMSKRVPICHYNSRFNEFHSVLSLAQFSERVLSWYENTGDYSLGFTKFVDARDLVRDELLSQLPEDL